MGKLSAHVYGAPPCRDPFGKREPNSEIGAVKEEEKMMEAKVLVTRGVTAARFMMKFEGLSKVGPHPLPFATHACVSISRAK